MGEFEFIESIRRAFEGVGGSAESGADGGFLGIGDDCAVLPIGGGEAFVVTCDMLVEGVHFLRGGGSARELGAKSLAVNLSDVAAMGARPVASFLSLALPKECRGEWADEFMEGYREMSARYGVRLAGGDTTASKGGVAINVTAIGRAPLANLKYRSGAQTGDIVVVAAPLGESAAGLQDILKGRSDTALAAVHRNPVPQVAEGEWLGGRAEVRSMIDLSDGLASDLAHILRASGRGGDGGLNAEIDLDAIPVAPSVAAGIPASAAIELAVTGGEDYKLLFTVAAEGFAQLAKDYRGRFGAELYAVGRVVESDGRCGNGGIVWIERGESVVKNWRGFVHF